MEFLLALPLIYFVVIAPLMIIHGGVSNHLDNKKRNKETNRRIEEHNEWLKTPEGQAYEEDQIARIKQAREDTWKDSRVAYSQRGSIRYTSKKKVWWSSGVVTDHFGNYLYNTYDYNK